jgi:omega-hydroxy-beta-dihydromenaquinone-9 sulfotransferase
VIVGNPRSGTTFLQRFLVDQGVGCGRQVWQMVYPSLTQQAVMRPLLPILEKVSPTRYHTSAAHKTGLTYVETDDASGLFRFTDGFFLYAFFLAHHDRDLLRAFDPRLRDETPRDFDWLEQLWRRSQVAHEADRVVAKVFGVGACLPAFQARFPDARVLYMARDPLSTIPSAMSLVTGVLDAAFGFWSLPESHTQRYLDRLYGGLVLLLTRAAEDWRAGAIDKSRVQLVPFPRLMGDFEGLMTETLEFVGHPVDDPMRAVLAERGEKQRVFRSPHVYDLDRFGLDPARIRADTEVFSETFLGP